MNDHASALARELGFLPYAEAKKFQWSQRATPRRVLEALLPIGKPEPHKLASDRTPKKRGGPLLFDDEKEWSG